MPTWLKSVVFVLTVVPAAMLMTACKVTLE